MRTLVATCLILLAAATAAAESEETVTIDFNDLPIGTGMGEPTGPDSGGPPGVGTFESKGFIFSSTNGVQCCTYHDNSNHVWSIPSSQGETTYVEFRRPENAPFSLESVYIDNGTRIRGRTTSRTIVAANLDPPFGLFVADENWSSMKWVEVQAYQGYVGYTAASIDDVVVTPLTVANAVATDIDPWNDPNEVRPTKDYLLTVAALTSSIAAGDDTNFDATQVDPETLKFGVGEAPNVVAVPIVRDMDDDSDIDVVFGFRMPETGIQCDDTEATLVGETYAGEVFTSTDSFTTVECDTSECHP